jgi:hypothetical protein
MNCFSIRAPVCTSAILGKPAHFRMSRLWQKYPMRKGKSCLNCQFECRCWSVSLECNTKCLTWIMVTFTTFDMSNLTNLSSSLMDQEQENSSLKKKRITTSSQIKTVLPTMHPAHHRRTITLTAMMKLTIQMTTIIPKWLSRTDPWQPRKHLLKGVHTHQLHHMLQRMVMTPTTCNYIHKLLKSVTIPVGLMRHL